MSPKKTKGKIVHTTSSATRTLRNRTIEMAAQLNQSELANLIRTIIRKENQAERLVFRSAIREEMSIAIEKVQSQLNAMDVTITQCKEKSAEVDEALSNMNSRITDLEESTTGLQVENTKLKDKIERLVMHSRKLNMRVFGQDNGIEKGNPTALMTSFFKEMFRSDELPGDPTVENAHRVGPDKNTPRAMLVRMQRLQVKQAIINLSKQKGSMNFRGMRVWIYPDLTSEETRRRAMFNDVRKKLREAKVRHGIRHPGTLLITFKRRDQVVL